MALFQTPHFRIKRPNSNRYWLVPALSTATFICVVLITATAINTFIFQSYYVEGTSMQPTLRDDDRLVVGKTGVTLADWQNKQFVPRRGDIVVLSSGLPDFTPAAKTERIVKRVIGLPGERVVVANGQVKIYNERHPNGFLADRSLGLNSLHPTFSQTPITTQLGEDEIFVLGDNRDQGGSLDSRSFGAVKLHQVEGTLWLRLLPLSDVKTFWDPK